MFVKRTEEMSEVEEEGGRVIPYLGMVYKCLGEEEEEA